MVSKRGEEGTRVNFIPWCGGTRCKSAIWRASPSVRWAVARVITVPRVNHRAPAGRSLLYNAVEGDTGAESEKSSIIIGEQEQSRGGNGITSISPLGSDREWNLWKWGTTRGCCLRGTCTMQFVTMLRLVVVFTRFIRNVSLNKSFLFFLLEYHAADIWLFDMRNYVTIYSTIIALSMVD